jgi:hypothetical protein
MDLLGGALEDHWSWLFASRLGAVVTKAHGAFGPEGWVHWRQAVEFGEREQLPVQSEHRVIVPMLVG